MENMKTKVGIKREGRQGRNCIMEISLRVLLRRLIEKDRWIPRAEYLRKK